VPDAECLRSAVAWWALSSEESRRQGYKVGEWRFRTLRGADESLGLIATKAECYGTSTGAVQDTLLDALTHQTGLALERCMLHDRLEQSRMKGETERLRLTVLTSISHDVRHPLASITASASVLDRQWATLADTSKLLMLRTIRNEAERLSDFIDKLLNLTSIESKILQTDCRRVDIADVVEAALQQASARFAGHRIELVIPEDLPPVWSDPVLLQQVLYNLIDNAVKYSQPASSIRIVACEDNQSVTVNILDEGTGLPNADLERIFDRFYRTPSAERQASGTGLGLAICRGFIEIMSGTIEAANRDDRTGSVFKISLPIAIHQELQEVEL
jgi:two-component system sensor histidine kinase KdpD